MGLTAGEWQIALTSDETADDSDKEFTVPSDEEWQLTRVWIELTTTATAGDRQLVLEIQDSESDVIGQPVRVRVVQAASLTRYYEISIAARDDSSAYDTDFISQSLPAIMLSAGQKLRVYDNNAVDAAADDMIVQIQYLQRSVA